jgi:purine nucleosidase
MVKRVILDTDIGTDVDDCIALALILASPELKLEGVTLVYGDVHIRGQIVQKLLRLRGVDIPIRLGASQPMSTVRPVYWAGHEGIGIIEPDDKFVPSPESAPDFIVRMARENPGEIDLLCIAPLTNAALAFQREPELAQLLAGITLMGGAVRGPGNFQLPYWEHNIGADAEASKMVFSSGAPITMVPLDVTTRVYFGMETARQLRDVRTPYHDAVAGQIELYPYVRRYGASHAHDPLAAAVLIDPSFVTLQSLHVDIETAGNLTMGASLVKTPSYSFPANVEVALGVDAPRFEAFLLERLLK